jgi:hypothetical protein
MVILAIITAFVMALHIWFAEPNVTVRVSFVKGLMFGAVYGSYDIETEDSDLIKASHYQISFAFIILTLEWYNEYE